jgi:hypothetical protein
MYGGHVKLVVFELVELLYQEITPDKNTLVEVIRPHLYKHNNPNGTLYLQIQDLGGQLVAQSPIGLTASEISLSDFYHGYISFELKVHLMKDVTYRLALVSTDYCFSEAAYIGWCSAYDLKKYPSDYSPDIGFNAPLDLEIWERTV